MAISASNGVLPNANQSFTLTVIALTNRLILGEGATATVTNASLFVDPDAPATTTVAREWGPLILAWPNLGKGAVRRVFITQVSGQAADHLKVI